MPEYIQLFSSDPNERATVIHGNLASSATETFTPGIVYRNFEVFKNALWWQRLSQNERRGVVRRNLERNQPLPWREAPSPPKSRRPTAPDKSTSVAPTLPIPSPQRTIPSLFESESRTHTSKPFVKLIYLNAHETISTSISPTHHSESNTTTQ